MEDPTYFIALSILQGDLGLKVMAIPMDEEGINIELLEKAIAKEKVAAPEGRVWGMIYTIPTFHNPTGLSMSRGRGRALIRLASAHSMLVFCDDVYNLLTYSHGALDFSRLRALEQQGEDCVISNCSLSKVALFGPDVDPAPPGGRPRVQTRLDRGLPHYSGQAGVLRVPSVRGGHEQPDQWVGD